MSTRYRNLSLETLRGALKDKVGEEKLGHISGWELLGEVVILKLPEELDGEKRAIGETILELQPRAKAVLNRRAITGVFREPEVELIAGDSTETIHREHGCVFKLDPAKVMFSLGNLEERRRMCKIAGRDEVVVDMFAGIGQLSIPLAKHSMPGEVHMIEKNPVAHHYLEENVRLNRLSNAFPILGDCRKVAPTNVADRVIMGYFFQTEKYFPSALKTLTEAGGMVHHHTLCTEDELPAKEQHITEAASECGFDLKVEKRVVKSYAPLVYHYVLDIRLS